ncbi:MAG: J domain-containing protein [Lachnospiraceae bacterium]|jgi:DnaJ-class molecular chaperone|nr:J domain-containing protein [Lachnospiraceae bacterium]
MMNLYKILGVASNASNDQIKRAYRRLAKKFHPDLNPGNVEAEKRFKEIVDAYEILGQPEKRKDYDDQLRYSGDQPRKAPVNNRSTKNPGVQPAWEDLMRRTGGGAANGSGNNTNGNNSNDQPNPADVSAMFKSFMGFK